MKRSNLALAVLTAIAVAACGGSSSNDDAPVDKKPETPAKPVKPTTPEAGNTETPEEKTPETPETPAVAGGGAGGAGGKTDTTKKDEKKPEAPAGGGHSGGKPKPKTPEAAAAAEETAKLEAEDAQTHFNSVTGKLSSAEGKLKAYKETGDGSKIAGLEVKEKAGNISETEKARLDHFRQKQKDLETAVNDLEKEKAEAEKKRDATKLAHLDAQIDHLELTEPKSAVRVKQLERDIEQAKQDEKKATADKKAAETKAGEIGTEVQNLQREVEKAEANASEASKTQNPEKIAETQAALTEAKNNLREKQSLQAVETNKANAAQERINAAKDKQKKAKEEKKIADKASLIRGQEGNATTIAAGGEFPGIDFVVKEDPKKDIWSITFKGAAEPVKLDFDKKTKGVQGLGENSSTNVAYGQFVFQKEEDKGEKKGEITADYGLVVNENTRKDNATSAYGYVNDKFFHFGQLAKADKITKDNLSAAQYKGSAFVKTIEDKPVRLIADVEATVKFENVPAPSLDGNFKNFQSYKAEENGTATKKTETKVAGVDVPSNGFTFHAIIDRNTFKPSQDNPGDAKVYGNFYGVESGKEAKEIGGFVNHDKFYGSFGGKSD